ncbi:hypothetical protein EV648_12521 [Kribbella sp. VKM Ac-2568]|nr:hypothetical protein EV648_12521 [Kribbella sp. VKM Ac-2568]
MENETTSVLKPEALSGRLIYYKQKATIAIIVTDHSYQVQKIAGRKAGARIEHQLCIVHHKQCALTQHIF